MARFDYIVVVVSACILLKTEEIWNFKPEELKPPSLRPTGSSDFLAMVQEGYHVVDKSEFIREVMESVWETEVICRPRQFGKSVCLSMLRYFLTIEVDKPSMDIFQNFSINTDTKFCNMYKNKFPVIYLDIISTSSKSYSSFMSSFKELIKLEYIKYEKILVNSALLTKSDKKYIVRVCDGRTEDVNVGIGIPMLMRYLYKHYGRRVVVLIDEYDTPVIDAFIHDFYPELTDTFGKIMTNIFKNAQHLEKGVMLGVTNVAKSISPPMSNVEVWSIVDEKFSEYFGFLEEEVDWLAGKFNLKSPVLRNKMARHYNGYLIGNRTVYNPWSVMMCLSRGGELRDWWKESGHSGQFYGLMQSYGALPVLKAEILTKGGVIRQLFKQNLVYTEIKRNENFFWTYSTQTGYLTFKEILGEKRGKAEEGIDCVLRIPNEDVKSVFKVLAAGYRKNLNISNYAEFVDSVKNRKGPLAEEILMKYLNKSADVFDGQDKVVTATEIMKGLELEYGPIRKIVKGYDYSLIVMEQLNGTRSTQFLIKATQNKSDLNLDTKKIKELFKKVGEGVLTKISADYVSYVLVFLYQQGPHFFFV